MATHEARIIHVTIKRDWKAVYEFAADPANMTRWASGLSTDMRRDGEDYVADGGPIGLVRIRFAPPNDYGVVDHRVTMENGLVFHNALRVVPNGSGAEVMFTLLKTDDLDDAGFERDAATILSDLNSLKAILESE